MAEAAVSTTRTTTPPAFLFYWLVGTLLLLPLLFGSNRPMWWAWSEVSLNLLTATTIFYSLLGREYRLIAIKPLHIAAFGWLLAVIGWQIIGDITIDVHATQSQMIKTICLLQVFFLTLILVDSRERLMFLVNALILMGVFQAVYGALMTLTGTEHIWNQPKEAYRGVATGTFINRNHLAGYLEMTLALGLGLLIASLEQYPARTWRQWLRNWTTTLLGPKARIRIYLALMVIGLILTQSRMGNTAFFGSMMIAGAIGLYLFRNSGRGIVLLFTSLLIIDIFLMGAFFGIDKVQERIAQTDFAEEERIEVNKLSLGIIRDNPWFGTGLGTYYTAFPQYRNEKIGHFYDHAHSDLIEFPSELGIIGTIPLIALVGYSFVTAIRVQLSRRSRLMRAMGFSATMGIIAIMMHSITDFNLQIFANAATFMVILALPFICLDLDSGRRRNSNRNG